MEHDPADTAGVPLRSRLFFTVLLLGLLTGSAACQPEPPDGVFVCSVTDPASCPPGFTCQNRGTLGQYRCYRDVWGECGDGIWNTETGEQCDQLMLPQDA